MSGETNSPDTAKERIRTGQAFSRSLTVLTQQGGSQILLRFP